MNNAGLSQSISINSTWERPAEKQGSTDAPPTHVYTHSHTLWIRRRWSLVDIKFTFHQTWPNLSSIQRTQKQVQVQFTPSSVFLQGDSWSMQIPPVSVCTCLKDSPPHSKLAFCFFVKKWNNHPTTWTGFWAKTNFSAFCFSMALFWGGPRPYFQLLFPPITPALLFTSEVSAFYQLGFPYPFLPSCVSFCGTWYTVCSVLMCFRRAVFSCSQAHGPTSTPHVNTQTYSRWWWEMSL